MQAFEVDERYQQIRTIVKEELNAVESRKDVASKYLTAIEFKNAVKIRRPEFNE